MKFLNIKEMLSKQKAKKKKAGNNQVTPPDVSISNPEPLTSHNLFVLLSASSNIPEAIYLWRGPSGFIATEQNIFVNVPGTYTVTVTDPDNDCNGKKSVVVVQELSIHEIKQHRSDLVYKLN